MNRKLFFVVAAIMVMALGVAGFAYKRASVTTAAAMSCCGDACPMKSKASTGEAKASCECCNGNSCPMKNGAHADKMAAHHAEGMPDNCPMHNAEAKTENASATVGTKTSCDCSCCNHNKEKAATPAV